MSEALIDLQKNKPNPDTTSGWRYQTEDDKWTRFYYPTSTSAIKRMEKELQNPLNWNQHLTIVRNIPPFHTVYVRKMEFPDGRVWDSKNKKFTYGKTSK